MRVVEAVYDLVREGTEIDIMLERRNNVKISSYLVEQSEESFFLPPKRPASPDGEKWIYLREEYILPRF